MSVLRILSPHFLFEDEEIVAVDKPSGLLVVPDRWDRKEDNLHAMLEARLGQKIWVVHRLDKDTSGIVLFAKTAESHRHLSLQFEGRHVRKEYLALAQGLVAEDAGSWTFALSEDLRHPGLTVPNPMGKASQTDYQVLRRFMKFGFTWLSLIPKTGRTHQIRVHLRCAGHPVVGDDLYGSGDKIHLSRLKAGYKASKDAPEKPLLGRLALHAYALDFHHPKNEKPLKFSAALPKDLEITLKYLSKA